MAENTKIDELRGHAQRSVQDGTAPTFLTAVTVGAGDAHTTTVRSPGTSGHAYGSTIAKLVAYAEQELAATGVPGMTLCLVDVEGFAAVITLGWADIDRRIQVDASHLFQIGSNSKSFAGLCTHILADQGKVDFNMPLSHYLPDLPLPADILVRHLLSHTAGLADCAPVFSHVPDRRLWSEFKPGTKFSYSSTGYELIGMLVEKICGKPYPLALRELVIEPLGIRGLREVIQASDRAGYAVGYSALDASGADMIRMPLGQTPWINIDTAAANIGTTADAMIPYLQYLIAVGRGQGAPLLSDTAAKRFCTALEPAAGTFGRGLKYASGLVVVTPPDDRPTLQHVGARRGFSSSIVVDPATGVGCFVTVNAEFGDYNPSDISKYACKLLQHVREGTPAPNPKEKKWPGPVESAEDYTGTYVAPDGDQFQLLVRSDCLFLLANGQEGDIQPIRQHSFRCNHPRFQSHFFGFERRGDAITAVWFGSVLYGRGDAVPQPTVPNDLAALQGTYFSEDSLTGWWCTIVAQGERLVIEHAAAGAFPCKDTLRQKNDYWYLENIYRLCERIRFDVIVNGKPQCLNFSGRNMWRFNRI